MKKVRSEEGEKRRGAKFSRITTPDRVPGTCQWFLQNTRYKRRIEDTSSGLLWVTADPDRGESVLSKSLIEHESRNEQAKPSSTNYFFFKDDSADQESVTKAICVLSHQILHDCEKPESLHQPRKQYDGLVLDSLGAVPEPSSRSGRWRYSLQCRRP